MIGLADQKSALGKLTKRRDTLRLKLRNHFSQSFDQRDYQDFEKIVDELDFIRQKIQSLKGA